MAPLMTESLIERMQWQTESGQILDGDRRYLLMRTDVLMGVFRNLPSPIRQQALQALQMSVRDQGGKSAKAYFASLGNDAQRLMQTMVDFSAQLGWGVWTMSRHDHGLSVHVSNSPFAHGFGPFEQPVCYPIVGMLETVGELILGVAVRVRETRCAAQGHAHCNFVAEPKT